jgi:hypothetical protein
VQRNKQGIYLRETEKFLVLNFEGTRSMKEAEDKLKSLENFAQSKPVAEA